MGAFALIDKSGKSCLDMQGILQTFSNKGFHEPKLFMLGNFELYLYQKQLVPVDNYYKIGKNAVYVIGTVIYKGLGYSDTIQQLLVDYMDNKIVYDQLIGSYCVIFYVNQKIKILNDALNVCKLFHDSGNIIISSSFLAVANGFRKLTINREASIEKLLTGYIVGEETLFNEIRCLIPSTYNGKWNIHKWPDWTIPNADRKKENSVAGRTEKIKEYFKSIEGFSKEFKPELGMSGGYDSRLLLAAALDTWPFKLDMHTHSTEGVHIHEVEKKIVQQIAEKTSTKLSIVPTHNMDFYDGKEIERILLDGYYYFDGRCAYNTGAFSPTYTRKYKLETVSAHLLTLNGLGGEVYRNYYMNIKPLVSIKQWMKAKVYPDGVDFVIDRHTFRTIHTYICQKMNKYSSFEWKDFATPFQIKRYYSEMRMPYCDSLNCNAHNQMEFYLTPFIERSMIEDAYKARAFTGLSGEFQAAMITKLNPTVASFKSHYGFPFSKKEPIKYKSYMLLRDLLPDSIWNCRINRIVKKNMNNNENRLYFERVREKCEFLKAATEYTEKLFPEINFDYLRADYAMMPNSSYVSVVFYMLRDKLSTKG